MNARRAGSNLALTSTFEENMINLTTKTATRTTTTTSFYASSTETRTIRKVKRDCVHSTLCRKSTSVNGTSKITSSLQRRPLDSSISSLSSSPLSSTSEQSPFWSTSFSSSASSPSSSSSPSTSSFSSSLSSSALPTSRTLPDSTTDARHNSQLNRPSSIPEASSLPYSSENPVTSVTSGVISVTRNDSVVNNVNGVKGPGVEFGGASFSTISGFILRTGENEVATEGDKERSSVNRDWVEKKEEEETEEGDEGFASGDESGDDSEPDDDNPRLISSTSRNIEETEEDSGFVDESSDSSLDNRLLESNVDGELLFGFVDTMEELESMPFNATSYYNENTSGIYNWNSSIYNETYIVLADGMYPSGYSLLQIILASIAATILMIVVVVGNMLVIIAIATEKALKNIQNWFIASLAVADFFLGLIIMPFSLANEIMGYWIFGYLWCDIYSAMDVLLSTASIMNLCLISLDRYWSITQAIDYLKKRTPARAALMITLVWLLSALICIPPLLGWKRPAPVEKYPKCSLSEDIGYVLYSALGSFYIPSCIMVFVYIRIYFAAKARARRGIRKQPRPRPALPPESPDIRQTSFTQSTPATDTRKVPGTMDSVATIENQPVQIPIVTCDFASDVSTSEADPGGGSIALEDSKDTLKVSMPIPMQKTNLKASLSVNGSGESGATSTNSSIVQSRCRAPSVGIDVDMVSEFDPSSSDSGVVSRCAVVKPLKLRLCRPIFGRKAIGKLKREHPDPGKHSAKDIQEDAKPPKPRDPEREKRRLARKKEKRATLILGLIMGSFIACWLPFFFLYIVKPLFPDLDIPVQAFAIAFWLGYMNSALNPVIYTVFNKDFRRAFRRILYK